MGKGILIALAAAVIGLSTIYMGVYQASHDTETEQAEYGMQIMAKEIAQSAFNIAVSRVKRDFGGYRVTNKQVPYQDGTYDITTSGASDGPVTVEVTGYYGTATHAITATIDRAAVPPLNAVTVYAPVNKVEIKDNYIITGDDTQDGSSSPGTGYGPDVHAVLTPSLDAFNDFQAEALPAQVYGLGGEGDIVMGTTEINIDSLRNAIATHPDRVVYLGDQKWEKTMQFGTPDAPVVLVVEGKVEMRDTFKGYGVVLVYGNVKMEHSATWEGLIVAARVKDRLTFEMKDNAVVYGAVVLNPLTDDGGSGGGGNDRGLPGGHFDVDVFDSPTSSQDYHEHQYDDKFDVTGINLLSAGCGKALGAAGGLCWNDFVADRFTQVRAEFLNPFMSMGTYTLAADGTTYTGKTQDGFTQTFDPSTVTQFTVNFDALCSLRGTSPGKVQSDVSKRDDAFSVRLYDTATNAMVYEVSVYHHIKSDQECAYWDSSTPVDSTNVIANPWEDVEPIEYKMEKETRVYYSTDAIDRLKNLLTILDLNLGYAVGDIRESR